MSASGEARTTGASDEALREAISAWNAGDQQRAIDTLRPDADAGVPPAVLLISWFLSQRGQEGLHEGVRYAEIAARNGAPWPTAWYFGTLADQAATRAAAASLIAANPLAGAGNDPLGRALQFANDDDPESALAMLRAAGGPGLWPSLPDSDEVARRLAVIDGAASEASAARNEAQASIAAAVSEVEIMKEDLSTQAGSLSELLQTLTDASSQKYFDDQALKYEGESKRFWTAGVVVLAVAALLALLPLFLKYIGWGNNLAGQANVTAHLGAAIAFAAVAGVLLARARSRDRDRQRNRDLSVALGTMFAYSEHIDNREEKERFKQDMGRLVLETFLRNKPPTEDSSRSVLGDIADFAKPTAAPQDT